MICYHQNPSIFCGCGWKIAKFPTLSYFSSLLLWHLAAKYITLQRFPPKNVSTFFLLKKKEWKMSHHFWQGGTVHDAQLARLELNVVNRSKAWHRGTLLRNDGELEDTDFEVGLSRKWKWSQANDEKWKWKTWRRKTILTLLAVTLACPICHLSSLKLPLAKRWL